MGFSLCHFAKAFIMNNNFKWPRVLVLLAAIMLAGALFVPIWKIELSAPQYPEGLVLKISANGLGGDVDIVNGLNHYIGMKTLHSEDFIEFTLLPYIIGSLSVLGFIAVFINRKRVYYVYIAFFLLVAFVSMADFYRWEYDYGHNLDPNAAIKVPDMSYQPPLIGYKQLLNFGAYSIPDIGGWLFIGAGVLLVIAYLLILQPRWLRFQRKRIVTAAILSLCLFSCNAGPEPIKYGSDACDFCKMTIMDNKFACEWVTDKGKAFRFDDLFCLKSHISVNDLKGNAYVNDFKGKSELMPAENAVFIKTEQLKSPMGGNVAAFAQKTDAVELLSNHNGQQLSWQQVYTMKQLK
jgi:copper chaperone NosL